MSFSSTDKSYKDVGIIFFLVILTVVAYWQLSGNGFVNFDDNAYITRNAVLQKGLNRETLVWAFTDTSFYWHPVTWLSLLIDHEMFGLNATGYHLVNLFFHIESSVLLFGILVCVTKKRWQSAVVALLFAVHPINVESVAWAVERKDVLSTFFFMLTLWGYVYYLQRPGWSRYLLVCATFAVGLMAKSIIVTLPCVLLLLDYWPLGRIRFGRGDVVAAPTNGAVPRSWGRMGGGIVPVLMEKIPLFLLSATAVGISILTSRGKGGVVELVGTPLAEKISHSLVAYVLYLGKIFWPSRLSAFYPYQEYSAWQSGGAALLLAVVTAYAVFAWKKHPWFVVGWCWYLGVILPVVGIVRTGLWPDIANRFAYIPSVGIYIIVAWGGAELTRGLRHRARLVGAAVAVVVCALALLTFRQTGYWRNTTTLFEHSVRVSTASPLLYGVLAGAYFSAGEYEEAVALARKEAALDPGSANYDIGRGQLSFNKKDFAAASEWVRKALLKKDDDPAALYLQGRIQEEQGEYEKAITSYNLAMLSTQSYTGDYYDKAKRNRERLVAKYLPSLETMRKNVAASPGESGNRLELALKLDSLGFYDEALQHYFYLEKSGVNSWILFSGIAQDLTKLQRSREAEPYYEKSLEQNPANTTTLNELGIICQKKKDYPRAISLFRQAMDVDGDYFLAPLNLGVTYLYMGDRTNAMRVFRYVESRFPDRRERVAEYITVLQRSGIP